MNDYLGWWIKKDLEKKNLNLAKTVLFHKLTEKRKIILGDGELGDNFRKFKNHPSGFLLSLKRFEISHY